MIALPLGKPDRPRHAAAASVLVAALLVAIATLASAAALAPAAPTAPETGASFGSENSASEKPVPDFASDIAPLLKNHCVKCHGPAKTDARLNLALGTGIVRGGKTGKSLEPGHPDQSLLWNLVADDSMPKGEDPLSPLEKDLLRRWIGAGAPGLPTQVAAKPDGDEHWAFQKLAPTAVPKVKDGSRARTPIDAFLQKKLEARGLGIGPEANRLTLIRRVSFDLTGLPPTPAEIKQFQEDKSPKAYEEMVERYFASARYGERYGKYWLDAAGYADSNGYFNADTDRPLAWRYRDYVIRAIQNDMPFDQFIREQLAGDEIARYRAKGELNARTIELLTATHYLRNSPDGTDSSDGNEDEVRADKYAVLEGTIQIMGSSLFGMTFQCARCHSHKFEPFLQTDYYSLQAVLYPAFNVEKWKKTQDRQMAAASPAELASHETALARHEKELAALQGEFREWRRLHPEPSRVLFADDFQNSGAKLAAHWSNMAPEDNEPLGQPAVGIDSAKAPGAHLEKGVLRLVESGGPGDRAISTRASFDWTPAEKGAWIQASFNLVKGAPYVGYLIALRDYNDKKEAKGGNILFDGAASGQAKIYLDYPGADSTQPGAIGQSGYTAGHHYGVRITNIGNGKFELAQLVDGVPEPNTHKLTAADLPNGGFGFALCCGRSFDVDQVRIESSIDSKDLPAAAREAETARQKTAGEFLKKIQAQEKKRPADPGKIAPVTDLSPTPPDVHLLERGIHKNRGARVEAAAPSVLNEVTNSAKLGPKPAELTASTGRRLALAQFLTRPDTRASALLARVTVNRWWQNHFGTGIVATTDNLGYSGTPPSHPELLEYLATELVRSGWSQKAIHRQILHSSAYRQTSVPGRSLAAIDQDNRLLSHFPLRRLDAEAVRDGMLAVSGELDLRAGGPYVPTSRGPSGEVVVAETVDGAKKRSVYLQQRRTQVTGILEVFDAPSIVFNCSARMPTTVPLQSLCLLNSQSARLRAEAMAARLEKEAPADISARLNQAFLLAWGRPASVQEFAAAQSFLEKQPKEYHGKPGAAGRAWTDLCNMLLAANAFLYVE